MGAVARAALVACCMCLGGCSGWSDFWSIRYGPGGTINDVQVDEIAERQISVLRAFAVRYQVPPDNFYWLALAGFNYSDEICSFYLDNLHQFERRKTRIKDSLILAGATTTAVMGAAQLSEQAVVYVTQAFGFSAGMIGIVAESYLYRLSPGILSGIVKTLHDAYRKNLDPNEIRSPEMAYYSIREYYSLCLPVTIEAKIEEYLTAAKGTKDPAAGSGAAGVTLSQGGVPLTDRGVPIVTPRP